MKTINIILLNILIVLFISACSNNGVNNPDNRNDFDDDSNNPCTEDMSLSEYKHCLYNSEEYSNPLKIQLLTSIPYSIDNEYDIQLDLTKQSFYDSYSYYDYYYNYVDIYVIYDLDTIDVFKTLETGTISYTLTIDDNYNSGKTSNLKFVAKDSDGNISETKTVQTLIRNSSIEVNQNTALVIDLTLYDEIGTHDILSGSADPEITFKVASYYNGKLLDTQNTKKLLDLNDDSYWTGSSKDTIDIPDNSDSLTIRAVVIDIDVSSHDDISPGNYFLYSNFSIGSSGDWKLDGGGSTIGFSFEIIDSQ